MGVFKKTLFPQQSDQSSGRVARLCRLELLQTMCVTMCVTMCNSVLQCVKIWMLHSYTVTPLKSLHPGGAHVLHK